MPRTMHAMIFDGKNAVLDYRVVDLPEPEPEEVRIRVLVCGVCRTDLHVVDGELPTPKAALIPGHEVVGIIDSCGHAVAGLAPGDRVGVPWLGQTCGRCSFCCSDRENLCDSPLFHGYTRDGGYAEYMVADGRFCLPLPAAYDDEHAAPLLCAGLIGYRTLSMAGDGRRLGIYGFGAAAHIVAQIAVAQGREVFAFTRPGDVAAQDLARDVGAAWAGSSDSAAPQVLDAALIFAPDGRLVPAALHAVAKGGTVVCGGIHMSDIPAFPYRLLWEERCLVSVANLTRDDGRRMMELATSIPIRVHTEAYRLDQANQALEDLRGGRVSGAAVLRVAP